MISVFELVLSGVIGGFVSGWLARCIYENRNSKRYS